MSSNLSRIVFLVLSLSAIIVSYFYVDRLAVDYFNEINFLQYKVFNLLQPSPELLLVLTPIGIIFYLVQRYRKQKNKFANFCLQASIAILVGALVKILLKFGFGRYWPDTFRENNLSYVRDHLYGFNPFHWGIQYQSFPSGHMITIAVFTFIVVEFYPRFKWTSILASGVVAFSLIAFYYHFVSDVIAGMVVGWMVALGVSPFIKKKITSQEN